jgi:transposase InsO family protein
MVKVMRPDKKLKGIFEYIEIFYNRKRRHSYLGLLSPMDFEYKYNQKTYENAA